ncbi:MAG: hydrogenase maturation nickel metallochaperone HypA [Candidatus Marinimicrobia bacterium]|nr:hydrogenase maturation nickel metallochaperone HypA [Candidatus Neomarinimicrobiota bacterium]MCF7840411.1 hydrogenase maturation nickel metallochaperone HypA [Candidatus Neomarinimicrobiota bacterium]
MSIALNIVESAELAARENHAHRITRIDLEIGELAGVLLDALNFSLEVATQNTLAATAQINIDQIKGSARCRNCGKTFHLTELWAVCPHCDDFQYEILAGKVLKIKTIDIE